MNKLYILIKTTKPEIYLLNLKDQNDIDLSEIDDVIGLYEIGFANPNVPPGYVFSAENPIIPHIPIGHRVK